MKDRSAGPAVAFDPSTGEIVTGPGTESLILQLVTSFGLPLVLNAEPALVVHASACVNDGEAVVFCGPSGSGKSSALVRLLDAGWRGLTEDVCCFDMRGRQPMAWPGPPWVRRVPGDELSHAQRDGEDEEPHPGGDADQARQAARDARERA